MRQYLDTLRLVLEEGTWLESRTGIRRISFPGVSMRFDLAKGFPAVTTRKLAFQSALGELCAFLSGSTSAAQFRAMGSRVWDKNANENQAWLENPCRAGEESAQLPDRGLEGQLSGRDGREPFRQIEPHGHSGEADPPDAGAAFEPRALLEHESQSIEILSHGIDL